MPIVCDKTYYVNTRKKTPILINKHKSFIVLVNNNCYEYDQWSGWAQMELSASYELKYGDGHLYELY